MTNYVSSISIDDVIDALKTFLTPFIPGGEIVRAQVNRVAMPKNPCAVLTELLQVDIDIPYSVQSTTTQISTIKGPQRIDVQIDFYGPLAGSYCKAVKSAFRTEWGGNTFPSGIKPLYTSDGIQSPLVTGEEQYESRWTLTVTLQYNPAVTVPQQSAIELSAKIVDAVDVLYPEEVNE